MAAGVARNNVLQRLKLNNKVALITGGHDPFPLGEFTVAKQALALHLVKY